MTASVDSALVQAFLEQPGKPPAGLKRLLRSFRSAAATDKYVLIELEPNRRWQLARLSGVPGGGVQPIPGCLYDSLEDAERDVFQRRWNERGLIPAFDLDG